VQRQGSSSSTSTGDASSSSSSSSSSSDSSSDSSSSSEDERLSSPLAISASDSGSDTDWVDSDEEARRQSRARRNLKSPSIASDSPAAAASGAAADELEAGFDMFLDSIDDLMGVPQAVPHSEAFRPRPGSAWKPAETASAAAQTPQQTPQSVGQGSVYPAGWARLPGGMRSVLQQAAALGLSDTVLQRAVVRLQALLPPPVSS
jgi:hypothetical protein